MTNETFENAILEPKGTEGAVENLDAQTSNDVVELTPSELKAELQKLKANNERLLAESKKNKERRQQLEHEKLIAEGNKDEVINRLKADLDSMKMRERALAIADAIAKEAEKRNCKRWDHLYKLTDGEFEGGQIEFDEDTGSIEGVADFFDYYSKNVDYSYYFQPLNAVKTNNMIPSTNSSISSINWKQDPISYLIDVKKNRPEKFAQEANRLAKEGLVRL